MTSPKQALLRSAAAFGSPVDPTLRVPQQVSYTYWPVTYQFGDPTVISQTPLPLSGVQFSKGMRMTGQLKASIQLADPRARKINPWALITPRKTGIIVVRSVTDPNARTVTSQAIDHFTVFSAPRDPASGRMNITANSIEGNWARRLITGTQPTTITPGYTYGVSYSYSSPNTLSPTMQINWLDGSGTLVGSTGVSAGALTPGTHQISSQHLAPAGAVQCLVIVQAAVTTGQAFTLSAPSFGIWGGANYLTNTTFAGLTGWTLLGPESNSVTGGAVTLTGTSAGVIGIYQQVVNNQSPTGAVTWAQVDQQQIAADLLNPARFSQIPPGPYPWPGWITVDPPTVPTGVLRDMTYALGSQTNLLQAHQDRSNVINGYEWATSLRVLAGMDPLSAQTYRLTFQLGYPRMGAQLANGDAVPSFSSKVDGSGNALGYALAYDGSSVNNIVWGNGAGYDSATVQALSTNSTDWAFGFLQSEGQYSNPDVSVQSTLQDYTNSTLLQAYASEMYLSSLTVRGDLPPYFGTYGIGDDLVFEADDWIWPDGTNGDRTVELASRIMGWTVTPPEGSNSEQVAITVSGGDVSNG